MKPKRKGKKVSAAEARRRQAQREAQWRKDNPAFYASELQNPPLRAPIGRHWR